MIDTNTINYIERNALAVAALEHLIAQKDNASEGDKVVDGLILPKDYELKSFETLLKQPLNYKLKLQTTSLADWLAYTASHANEDSGIFIDKENMSAKALIDMGNPTTPQWGYHQANLQLTTTPEYHTLIEANNKTFAQQSFIELLQNLEGSIAFYVEHEINGENEDQADDEIPYKKALQYFRRLSSQSIKNFEQSQHDNKSSATAEQSYEIKSNGQKPINKIVMTSPVYEGLPATTLTARLRYDTSNEGVKIALRIPMLSQLLENRAQAFKNIIDNNFTDKAIKIMIAKAVYQ
ncbi:MAG: YfdQ family protein [Magnetococcus sp. YQC-3]